MPGVYISYPFCAQKCTYCNFSSGVFTPDLERRYIAALRAELAAYPWPCQPDTVYFGGGTPSRISTQDLTDLLEVIPGRPWREATLEVAPGDVTLSRAQQWRDAGINRVSLGVQSFARSELARTGRKHTADIVHAEVALLREAGLPNFNIDLIAGLAGQTAASWLDSLQHIERLRPPHVSVYMLEVDDDSRLGRELLLGGVRYGALDVPSEQSIVDFYQSAVERLETLGILRYEISNFAQPGAESWHNLKYWRCEPYLGFGADAHSLHAGQRWQNVETPREFVERSLRGESPVAEITPANEAEERFLVGLRLRSGIQLTPEDWERFDVPLRHFLDQGLLEHHGTALRLTDRGVLFSNEVLQEFLSA
jgi:oxygen-independent coproporphyrinogen III oxidase